MIAWLSRDQVHAIVGKTINLNCDYMFTSRLSWKRCLQATSMPGKSTRSSECARAITTVFMSERNSVTEERWTEFVMSSWAVIHKSSNFPSVRKFSPLRDRFLYAVFPLSPYLIRSMWGTAWRSRLTFLLRHSKPLQIRFASGTMLRCCLGIPIHK